MELKNSQIHPFSKGKGLLWQEDKKIGKHIGCVDYAIHYKKGTTCLLSDISAF